MLESRRKFLYMLSATTAVGTTSGFAHACMAAEVTEALQVALKARAIPNRSIDFSDDDFSDLDPVGHAIGTSRVVQLGEPSHGAGSAFAAKARLVKYLHQRHGFDVLAWESGLFDVALAEAAMCSASWDAMTAARKGVFTLWSEAAEVKPLFEYMKASHGTLRPLEMAGFDLQVTADGSTERFAEELRSLAGALTEPSTRSQANSRADDIISARARLYTSKFSDAHDLESLTAAVKELRELIATKRSAFEIARGALYLSFMDRALEDVRADAALRVEAAKSAETTTARESTRDALNAANLRWLIEERYAGRKVLVWAHNVHVMDAYYAPGFREVHLEARQGDMKTTGTFMKDWYGDQVYTIGMTAYRGEEGFAMGGPKTAIAPAPDESLESHVHSLGYPFAFLDFRSMDRANPLRQRIAVRTPKFDVNVIPDVRRVYDGMFFIDQMAAATHA